MKPDLIICNPGYGNGPYLRCAEIALSVGGKIVMPLIYGDKQKRIMEEEFGPDHGIEFDEWLGKLIESISFKHESYSNWLLSWLEHVDQTQEDISKHISETYGSYFLEIARSPIVNLGGQESFAVLFSRSSEVLSRAIDEDTITIDKKLLKKAAERFKKLEDQFTCILITEPGTFPASGADESVPLTAKLKANQTEVNEQSVYVSVSGIPNQKLDSIMNKVDLPMLTNKDTLPHVLADENVVFQVARSGWGACWMSLLTGTPLITPEYDPSDDPEIYFNNKRIEELGIGVVHKGELISELLPELPKMKKSIEEYRSGLEEKYGTLDGAELTAKNILALTTSHNPANAPV